jgi:Ca2+-binding RTX toxin-like protein
MSAFTTAQWVNLASRASSKVSALANFESLRGNHVTGSTLIAGNTINDWVLDGANAGSVNGVQFVGFTDLTGGTARDVFHVLPEARVAGRVNGVGSENTLDFSRYGTAGVTVDLGAGTTSSGVARITNFRIVIGSDGNDTLKSGSVGSLMLGGGGDDSLLGAGGRDIFLGGRGADVLKGGYGEDLLFGGATSYYDEDGTKTIDLNALEALLRLWGSSSSYTTRMSQLLGGTSAVRLSSATLVDDVAAADVLFGGLGTGSDSTPDWFLKNAEDQSDRIGDLNSRIDKTTVL